MMIKLDPEKQITLYNRDFDAMRDSLDKAIRQIIADMILKDMDAGRIGLTIDISLVKSFTVDSNADSGMRPCINPEVNYKIGTAMQQKDETKGNIIPAGRDELLTDGNGNFFLVTPEEASGQLSLFDTWDEYAREARK